MRIIDAQIHQPQPLGGHDGLAGDQLSLELAVTSLDVAGVDAAVLAAGLPFTELAVRQHPDKFAGVFIVPSDLPDMGEEVARVADRPGIVGIRVTEPGWPPTGEGVARLRAGVWEPAFAEATRRGLPAQLFLAGCLEEGEPFLKAHPDLNVILIHFGLFRSPANMPFQEGDPFRQLPLLLDLARFPNVVVQLSNGPGLSLAGYPYADLWPALHQIFRAYGPERLMWGSDFTRNRGVFHYAEWVHFWRDTTELGDAEKEQIFSLTLRRVYGWPEPL